MNETAPVLPVKKNGLAIASLVVGIVSVIPILSLGNVFGLIEGIVAVVLGFIGVSQIKKSSQGGKGMAVAGIIMGFVTIAAFILFIFVLAPALGGIFDQINQGLMGV